MKAGACDYIMKHNLARLVPAVQRELREAAVRAKRRHAERSLRALEKAVETLPLGVTVADTEGRILYSNPAEAALHGYTPEELRALPAHSLAPVELWQRADRPRLFSPGPWRRERVNVRKDGTTFPAYMISDVVKSATGEPLGIVTTCEDITERRWAEEQLRKAAFSDPLTGLPNRALFMDRLGLAVERARRHPDFLYAVLFMDLDRFKIVNDSLGHVVGDRLLIEIAARLRECRRSADTVARLGGDEFAILAEEIPNAWHAVHLAGRFQEALRRPFSVDGREVFTTVSVGIALSSTSYTQPEEILRDADTALYRAKGAGRDRHEVFDQGMHTQAKQILLLETELRQALAREEFLIQYQPLVWLATGETTAVEALVRWQHPTRGLLLPQNFIPLCEETGLIKPLGQWVLRTACDRLQAWRARWPELRVAVNLSARQFGQPNLAGEVDAVLSASGLPPRSLELEITESLAMEDAEATDKTLHRLKALGVRVAIDDFGTGYSSLAYLKRFPVDALKIDRSFVSSVTSDRRDASIAGTVIDLAHSLDLEVVAEGVETPEQLEFFRGQHCDAVQGFLLGVPASELPERPGVEP
jgi:diguanylate cyclase (GGDEF)-like protein/PAS domain S-box-containing protein